MVYEHIFNINGHAEAVVLMNETEYISNEEIKTKLNAGEYALNLDYAFDNMPTDCAFAYCSSPVSEENEPKVDTEKTQFVMNAELEMNDELATRLSLLNTAYLEQEN